MQVKWLAINFLRFNIRQNSAAPSPHGDWFDGFVAIGPLYPQRLTILTDSEVMQNCFHQVLFCRGPWLCLDFASMEEQ